MAGIHELLDRYKSALVASGLPHFEVADAPSPTAVEAELKAAGLQPLPALVEWFSWGGFPVEDRELFFWETGFVPSVDSSLKIRSGFNRDVDEGLLPFAGLESSRWSYPGERDWLVVAHMDTSEIVSFDAGFGPGAGSIWFTYMKSTTPSVMMFPSLDQMLEAAIFCVESRLWTVGEHRIESARTGMPSFCDLLEPPDNSPNETTRYYVHSVELADVPLVAVGEFDGQMECAPLGGRAAHELASMGYEPKSTMTLREISLLPVAPRQRQSGFVGRFSPEEWDLYRLADGDDEWGVLLSFNEPGKHWNSRRWVDPEQLADLTALGAVAPYTCGLSGEDWPGRNEYTTEEIVQLLAEPGWLAWQRTFFDVDNT